MDVGSQKCLWKCNNRCSSENKPQGRMRYNLNCRTVSNHLLATKTKWQALYDMPSTDKQSYHFTN